MLSSVCFFGNFIGAYILNKGNNKKIFGRIEEIKKRLEEVEKNKGVRT